MPNAPQLVPPLLAWFAAHARDLPWRRTRDPYAIWISEVMLQQTQVATVIPYWDRWLHALPDVAALARAPLPRVLKLWEGLGYYSRARNLQRAAQVVLAEHAGRLPRDFDAVLALPGIGRYTAGAICSLAFNQPTPVLDGNVARVLARVFCVRADVTQSAVRERLWSRAAELVQAAAGWKSGGGARTLRGRGARRVAARPCGALNEALMELGAVICTPRNPRCEICPIAALCQAHARGLAALLPARRRAAASRERRVLAFVCEDRGRLLARPRPAGGVNAGLWELPNEAAGPGADALATAQALIGPAVGTVEPLLKLRHVITTSRIQLEVFRVRWRDGARPATCKAGRWLSPAAVARRAFTAAHRRVLERLTRD